MAMIIIIPSIVRGARLNVSIRSDKNNVIVRNEITFSTKRPGYFCSARPLLSFYPSSIPGVSRAFERALCTRMSSPNG